MSYDMRRDSGEGIRMSQRGVMAAVQAATDTYIWQPWFALVGGDLQLTSTLNDSSRTDPGFGTLGSDMKGVVATGSMQLRVLPYSQTPFEAHVSRNDTRTTSELVSVGDYVTERIGFSQQYLHDKGDMLIGWDRNSSNSAISGRDHQDSLQLSLSHNIDEHRITMLATRSRNVREITGENLVQDNMALQHSFAPTPEVTVDTTANSSRAGYMLLQGENDTRVQQLSSTAFWRPEEMPLTVVGGVRLLTLTNEFGGNDVLPSTQATVRNANINLGATYDITDHLHVNASANANSTRTNGRGGVSTNESVGVGYQPESIRFDNGFNYNWSTSASASKMTGGPDAGSRLTLQLSHNLNRSFQLDDDSVITMEINQAIAAISASNNKGTFGEPLATRQVTHGGSVSWNTNFGSGSASVRLSANDSRSLDGYKEYFQLINFQASSNLPTSVYTTWNGNLTIQAVRQGGLPLMILSPDTGLPIFLPRNNNNGDGGFTITSSGSVTYMHSRFLGFRNLRFTSDLRLNGQALLPMLGGPRDQEVAAWDNRIDYFIGRTQLRLATMIARTKSPVLQNPFQADVQQNERIKLNKSIMFTVMRKFGDN